MKKIAIVIVGLLIFSGSLFAELPYERLIKESRNVSQLINNNARFLSLEQINQISSELTRIKDIINGTLPPLYQASVTVDNVSRIEGGFIYVFKLVTPIPVNKLEVLVSGKKMKIHSASMVMYPNSVVELPELMSENFLYDGDKLVTPYFNSLTRQVSEIHIRAEAWAQNVGLTLTIKSHVSNIQIINNQMPVAKSFLCSAACTSLNGFPDISTSILGEGRREQQARDNAIANLRSVYSCSYGVAIEKCSELLDNMEPVMCIAGCKTISGELDISVAVKSSGRNTLEAMLNSRSELKRSYNCSYGIVDGECSNLNDKPTYCTAACKGLNGNANLTTSVGAEGDNKVDAKINAINALKEKYNCSYGLIIHQCEII
ncbi:MAG: hypothetical protein A2381_18425 [Bdellovibrionales bacterium RIFOXYB1_FULL_37_110]|nr:MAG: hypothetical protein A2417_01345 [Bdellovibrionales bacterium RIFOXYC1_FULL_37_79]OFZ59008.1 MAG: hypothetical protein A2381_18425 [Bdellovibrionales bacterium RIFOXYB1_FULL_37_110]OFZ65113.1 MAG: hypothetical protein A2577_04740 [Bdellovibrionales bacterium RIFOXYD1_FULL_36_51]